MSPRFPFQFNEYPIDASNPKIYHDHNRCILCKRCIRIIKDKNGKSIFAFENRARKIRINFDSKLGDLLTDELAEKAMEICPVGSIIVKEKGFNEPIGTRKFDCTPIGR